MKRMLAIICAAAMVFTLFGAVTVNAAASKFVDQNDYDETIVGQSLDIIKGDGTDLYKPGDTGEYLSNNGNTVYGPFATVTMRGWIGFEQEITEFGYVVGDGEPVFSPDFFVETEGPVKAAGGEYALRFEVTADVSAVTGAARVLPLAKLEDGTVVGATYYNITYTTEKAPEVTSKPVTVNLTADRTNTPVNFSGAGAVGFRFTVPEGMKLVKFTVVQAPTWNGPSTGIGCYATIYRWTGDDYEETIDSEIVAEYAVEDHRDCSNMDITFSYVPAGEYLIELTEFTGNLGGWAATAISDDYAESFFYYLNGEENENPVHCKMTLSADDDPPAPTEKPAATEAPTEKPTEEPTAAPTEAPTAEPTENAPEATARRPEPPLRTAEKTMTADRIPEAKAPCPL